MTQNLIKIDDYKAFIQDIKQHIQTAQIKAAVAVNQALLQLYWDLAERIVAKQQASAWGDGFLQQMSRDLQPEFPDIKGFSKRNLELMRQWYRFWVEEPAIAQQLVSQIPWGHNLIIISKIKNIEEARFYIHKTVQNNWSRAVLTHQIESCLYQREGKTISNFQTTLPSPQSDLAKETLKDPYHFDLLFYHVKLHCYVVVELKALKFKPEFAGKLNFYVSAVDSGEIDSFYEKLIFNLGQIRTLETLRDTLLPKLMSGEVRVKSTAEEI